MRLVEKTLMDIVPKLPMERVLVLLGGGWIFQKKPNYCDLFSGKDIDLENIKNILSQTNIEYRIKINLPKDRLLVIDRLNKGKRLSVKICGNKRGFNGFIYDLCRPKLIMTFIENGVVKRTRNNVSASESNGLLLQLMHDFL